MLDLLDKLKQLAPEERVELMLALFDHDTDNYGQIIIFTNHYRNDQEQLVEMTQADFEGEPYCQECAQPLTAQDHKGCMLKAMQRQNEKS